MNWRWFSRKGNERSYNHDAAGLVVEQNYVFAIIADAAKSDQASSLAHYWVQTHIQHFQGRQPPPTYSEILLFMEDTHRYLRRIYPYSIASYCAVLLHKHTEKAWVVFCGDCRLGLRDAQGEMSWISNVHTVANFNGDFFTSEYLDDPLRHTLTRRLTAKRFMAPEVMQFNWPFGNGDTCALCLCSDGYWAEHLGLGSQIELLSDDASCLIFSISQFSAIVSNSDGGNFFIM
jgi:serine/threonine protein phosphatase PrpC